MPAAEVLTTPAGKLPLRRTEDGWYVLEIRGERDVPGYEPREVGRGMSTQTYRREVLGDWTASAGKVVYPEYGDIHEPREALPFDPELPLVLGWDLPAATGGTPACVVSQVSHAGQWLLYGSVMPGRDEAIGVWAFGERVADYLQREFAAPAGLTVNDLRLVHYGDPAGNAKPLAGSVQSGGKRVEVRSAFDTLRLGEQVLAGHDDDGAPIIQTLPGRGWVIQPGAVSLRERLEAVRGRLMTLLSGGAPALLVDPGATVLREAFRGGYNYAQRTDGQYELDPAKNRYSHPMDAMSYTASRLFALRSKDEDEGGFVQPVTRAGRRRSRW